MRSFAIHGARISILSVVFGAIAAGCVDPNSPLITEGTEGCDEIRSSSSIDSVEVDGSVRDLMHAASDFTSVVRATKQDVLTACGNVARDLGADDSWSAIEDADDAISNSAGTGACDRAAEAIDALLPAQASALIAIDYAKGYCYVDYQKQVECDEKCTTEEVCEPGPAETRCEPGSLSVKCDAECQTGGTCVGTREVAANCMGMCESECQGQCMGTCTGRDGKKTDNDPNCRGKCSSTCIGTCKGRCKIDVSEGCDCGTEARCQGGCTTTFTEPVCVTEYGPPQCTVEESCHEVCTARVWANPVCVPTTVSVHVDLTAHPELTPLKATLEANLALLVDVAEHRGPQIRAAVERLGDASAALEDRSDDFDGKSVACAAEATNVVATELDSIEVSVEASVRVATLCNDRAD